jgi:hypothetical protein
VDEEVEATFQRAEKGFEDGRASFEARRYDQAERKLRTTLKEYGRSVVLLRACDHYCDALAMYAATLHARGDVEEAKLMTLDLLALSPTYDLSTKKFTKEFIQFRAGVATAAPAQLRGLAVVRTRPGGARVYVDGEMRGYTPLSIGPLPMGKHLLRLERPGYRQRGELVEITPEEQQVTADLVPTPLYKKYNSGMEAMALEVVRPQMGPAIASAAKTLSLDRVIVGALKELNNDGGTEVVLGLFDARSGRRLSDKKVIFQGDEFGQLRTEVGRTVTALMNGADGNRDRPVVTKDPLQGKHGTEEWSGDDRGGKNTQSDRIHPPKDPLQGMSGTEDW